MRFCYIPSKTKSSGSNVKEYKKPLKWQWISYQKYLNSKKNYNPINTVSWNILQWWREIMTFLDEGKLYRKTMSSVSYLCPFFWDTLWTLERMIKVSCLGQNTEQSHVLSFSLFFFDFPSAFILSSHNIFYFVVFIELYTLWQA